MSRNRSASPSACAAITTPCERVSAKRPKSQLITPRRTRRQPRACEHQRHPQPLALVIQIGPEFGLKDDGEPRPHPFEKSSRRAGQVKWHEAHLDRLGKERPRTLRAARRCGGEDERQVRIAGAQIEHQSRRRLYFAHRYRVHPDARPIKRAAKSEALRELLPVAAFTQAAP